MKRWLAGTAVTALLCGSLAAPVFGADQVGNDVSGHWAEARLLEWVGEGKLTGYDDGTLRPDRPIQRGDWFVLVNRSFGFSEHEDVEFQVCRP